MPLILLFVCSGASALTLGGPSSAAPGGPLVHPPPPDTSPVASVPAHLRTAGPGTPGVLPTPTTPPASGRGIFFNTTAVPRAPAANCGLVYSYACVNDSFDPSVNYSATPPPLGGSGAGTLAVAYTQITNDSPCVNASPYAYTEIGFVHSGDLGASWSAPEYLGVANCSLAMTLPSAYQPTLTSLANGTLVLAYIAYNTTGGYSQWFTQAIGGSGSYYSISGAALVLRESYDGGVTWTPSDVLNESLNPTVVAYCCSPNATHAYTPQRPWIAAVGSTIYLAWTNDTIQTGFDYYCEVQTYTYSACYGQASSQVHVLVSTNGGASWVRRADLATVRPALNQTISGAENPYVLVLPNGTVDVAYLTDFYLPPWSVRVATGNYLASGAIELASSSDNGSTFDYTTVATNLSLDDGATNPPYEGGQWDTIVAPQLAYSPRYAELYVTWTMDLWGVNLYCPLTCPADYLYENIYLTNSSDGGSTWSPYHLVSAALNDSRGSAAYDPAIAVLPDGQVDIAAAFTDLNQSVNYCYGASFNYWFYCGPVREVFLSSTDNGTSFSSPVLVSDNMSANPNELPGGWYDTATVVNGSYFFAWSHKFADTGPGNISLWPGTCCGYALEGSEIDVSHVATGPGLTLTYQETGLPAGFSWGLNIMGNLYSATAPGSITVTGVVPSENLTWTVAAVPGSAWGSRYFTNETPVPPTTFASSTIVYENFSEQVLVDLASNPPGEACPVLGNQAYFVVCWDPAQSYYYHFNYDLEPFVGPRWVAYGVPLTLNASPANMCFSSPQCAIYTTWENLTFQSWTGGSTPGSVNTSQGIVTITPKGPINETANFQIVGICTNANLGSFDPRCSLNETLEFHESGLPKGTQWNVSIENGAGATEQGSASGPTLELASAATTGIVNYTVWTVPSSIAGEYWIPTSSPGSPVVLPTDRVVNVTFHLGPLSSGSFAVELNETGLSNVTASGWAVDFGATDLGVRTARTVLAVLGGTYALDVPGVYFENGTGFYAASVTVERYLVNGSAPVLISSLPSNLTLDGPSLITVHFAMEFFLTVTATAGGSVSPASFWVPDGARVTLTATANATYHFVGWAGAGSGSADTSAANLTLQPTGPVTEAATFAWNGPPVWSVEVTATGLASGTQFTVGLGNASYSGTVSFSVTNLTGGDYPVMLPYAYSNASEGTRYVGSIASTSYAEAGAGVLAIGSNGDLNLSFSPEYEVSATASSGGTVAPTGPVWVAAGGTESLTAVPASGYDFVGWMGTGPGALNSATPTITVTASGPIDELAEFAPVPAVVPATYSLAIDESGLPSGTAWSVAVGTRSAQGATSGLSVGSLNGTYNLSIPDVNGGFGIRYVVTSSLPTSLAVSSDQQLTVTFQTEYWIDIVAGAGGTTTSASAWTLAGAATTLAASAAAGWSFAGWVGSGSGSYTGPTASTTFTAAGPVNETATFAPTASSPASTGASGTTEVLAIAAGLLVAGILVGLWIGRRPAARPKAPAEPEAPTGEEEPSLTEEVPPDAEEPLPPEAGEDSPPAP